MCVCRSVSHMAHTLTPHPESDCGVDIVMPLDNFYMCVGTAQLSVLCSPGDCFQYRWPSSRHSYQKGRSDRAGTQSGGPTPCTRWTHQTDASLRERERRVINDREELQRVISTYVPELGDTLVCSIQKQCFLMCILPN